MSRPSASLPVGFQKSSSNYAMVRKAMLTVFSVGVIALSAAQCCVSFLAVSVWDGSGAEPTNGRNPLHRTRYAIIACGCVGGLIATCTAMSCAYLYGRFAVGHRSYPRWATGVHLAHMVLSQLAVAILITCESMDRRDSLAGMSPNGKAEWQTEQEHGHPAIYPVRFVALALASWNVVGLLVAGIVSIAFKHKAPLTGKQIAFVAAPTASVFLAVNKTIDFEMGFEHQ